MSKLAWWRSLTVEKRLELVKRYGIIRSGPVYVVDNKIVDDGAQEKDLLNIDTETYDKPQEAPIPFVGAVSSGSDTGSCEKPQPKRRGRPRKETPGVPKVA